MSETNNSTGDVITKITVSKVMGVPITFDSSTGRFSAKYDKGDGDQEYSREKYQDMESDITTALYGFTGAVPVTTRPSNPIYNYERARSSDDTRTGFLANRTTTITGVRRTERDRYGKGGTVVFTVAQGCDTSINGEWVEPAQDLDTQYADLLAEWHEVQKTYRERFEALRAKYKSVAASGIVARLRAQGAKVPRGA